MRRRRKKTLLGKIAQQWHQTKNSIFSS